MKQLEQFYNEEFLKDYDYHELNIEKFRKVIGHAKVVEPLDYLLNIEPKVGVTYQKYLYVKALHSKLTKNKKNFNHVQKLWELWVRE